MKIQTPKFDLIEHTAMKFAVVWYEAARSSGLKSKHKTARLWALHNFEKFIPQATSTLMEMLSSEHTHQNVKDVIYHAIMERVNDPTLQQVQPIDTLPNIDVKKLLDMTPIAPIVIETKPDDKPVFKKFEPKIKDKLKGGIAHG